MTTQETAKIMAVIKVAYPHYYKDITSSEAKETALLWQTMLADYEYITVSRAVKALIAISKYPPTIAEVIEKINTLTETEKCGEIEAWGLVKKALRNSYYNAELEFNNLPDGIKRALGSFNVLREWALVDSGTLDTVIASNFIKSYRAIVKREQEEALLPRDVKEFMKISTKGKNLLEEK